MRNASSARSAGNARYGSGCSTPASNSAITSPNSARSFRQRPHQLVGVDAEIADVVAERPQPDMAVFIEVALAGFEESTERPQRIDAAHHCFTGERIQHDVDAPAARQRARISSANARLRESSTWSAPSRRTNSRFVAARRREHFRAEVARELDRGDPDTTRAAVHEHRARRDADARADECVVRGEERGRHGRRFLERQPLGFQCDRLRARPDARRERSRREAEHRIARRECRHRVAHPHDAAGQFHPDRRAREAGLDRFIGQDPIAYITSRKLRPVATSLISTSSSPSGLSGNANHSRLRNVPRVEREHGRTRDRTIVAGRGLRGGQHARHLPPVRPDDSSSTAAPVSSRISASGIRSAARSTSIRRHASSGCSFASTRPRPHSVACSGCAFAVPANGAPPRVTTVSRVAAWLRAERARTSSARAITPLAARPSGHRPSPIRRAAFPARRRRHASAVRPATTRSHRPRA